MTNDENKKQSSGKLVLDVELQDLLDIVSKAGGKSSISDALNEHAIEGEALKKAWFKHVLLTLEKLNDHIETTRVVDIPNLRAELKADMGIVKSEIKETISKLEKTVEKNDDSFKQYQKDTIIPMASTLTTVTVKFGILAAIFSLIGSSVTVFILYLLRDYVLKSMLG